MLLALVLSVQATTAAAATPNPCTDQMSELCKISPLFCPGAYPADLQPGNGSVPCWPEKAASPATHDTRVVNRPTAGVMHPTTAPSTASSTTGAGQESATRSDSSERGRSIVSRFFARLIGR